MEQFGSYSLPKPEWNVWEGEVKWEFWCSMGPAHSYQEFILM